MNKRTKFLIKLILSTGIIKTLRFNFHYFGICGLVHPYVFLDRHVKIQALKGNITLSKNLHIASVRIGYHWIKAFDHKYRRAVWENYGNVKFLGRVDLCSGTGISNFGELEFGNGVFITANSYISCYRKIKIGANCLFSWDVQIMDADSHKLYLTSGGGIQDYINPPNDIIIGEHCWICSRVLILKGVSLPDNTVVAAGSVITSSLKLDNEYCVVGDKNKIIKENVGWEV